MDRLATSLIDKIQEKTGIIVTEDLQPAILEHINRRMSELNLTIEAYRSRLESDDAEMELLVNASTVNETYFFRDESFFDFLMNTYFPSKIYSNIRIWCGACSTGEESISIHAMTRQMGINADITATDIDTEALAYFKKGSYSKKSFRDDGKKYHRMIRNISTEENGSITINPEEINRIHISCLNLSRDTPLPFVIDNFDLIILRNIFIYFSTELILKILSYLWPILKEHGILFLTTNEIAAIPENDYFEKKKEGDIYYLQKKKAEKKSKTTKDNSIKENRNKEIHKEPFSHSRSTEKDFDSELNQNIPEPEKKLYKDILKSIDKGYHSKAEEILSTIDFSSSNLEFKYFFLGLIKYQTGRYEDAEIDFYKSAMLNQDFWPSSIMLALTYKHIGNLRKTLTSFEQTLNILIEYVKNGKTCYNFTIDFDPVYMINICRKNIDEIREIIGE